MQYYAIHVYNFAFFSFFTLLDMWLGIINVIIRGVETFSANILRVQDGIFNAMIPLTSPTLNYDVMMLVERCNIEWKRSVKILDESC